MNIPINKFIIFITIILFELLPCRINATNSHIYPLTNDSISTIQHGPSNINVYPDKPDGPTPEPIDPTIKGPEKVWVHEDFDKYSTKPCLETAKKTPVKNIPINFDVTPTGAASFSLPIEVPCGIGSTMPTLSVVYNSQTNNGLIGSGCNIEGISSITRGVSNIWHDGKMRGINGNNDDALYLDGTRLILRKGQPLSDGSLYSPENDPYLNVICHGNGAWFEIQRIDGTTAFYGNRGNSRQQIKNHDGSTITYTWYISETSDANSNNIIYDYYNNGVFYYPKSITYGTNKTHASFTYNNVSFHYESRPDTCFINVAGTQGKMAIRLHDIITSAGDSIYRKYEFNYVCSYVTGKTYLDKVYVSGTGGSFDSRIEALSTEWNYAGGFRQANRLNLSSGHVLGDKVKQFFISADINGDGISDIIEFTETKRQTTLNGNIALTSDLYCIPYLSKSDGNGNVSYIEKPSVQIGYNTKAMKGGVLALSSGRGRYADIIIPELNKTGNSDIMMLHLLEGSFNGLKDCYELRPQIQLSAHHKETPLCASADFDGDGRDEIIVVEKSGDNDKYGCTLVRYPPKDGISDTCRFTIELDSVPKRLFAADFDANGTADIMVVTPKGYRLLLNSCGGKPSLWKNISSETVKDANLLELGDFNGDGIPDFASCKDGRIFVASGDGNGYFKTNYGQHINGLEKKLNKDYSQMVVYDFNGDGKSDIVIAFKNKDGSHALWLQSKNAGFILVDKGSSPSSENARNGRCTVGDFNGDGIPDMLNYGNCLLEENSETTRNYFYTYLNGFTPETGKIKSIRDAFGKRNDIEYASMATGGIYTPSEGAVFPVVDILPPITAVSGVTRTNGVAGSNHTKYNYEGLKMHLQGRDLIGIEKFMASNETLGTSSCTQVLEWDTKSMLPIHISTTTKSGNEEAVSQTYSSIIEKEGKCFFSYPRKHITTDFNGNITEQINEYDTNNGKPLRSLTKFNDGSYTSVEYTGYEKHGTRWQPHYIKTTTKHTDDTDEFHDDTELKYDARGNVIREIIHAGSEKELATIVEYDIFGNPIKIRKEGIGASDIAKIYEYDYDGFFVEKTYTEPSSYVFEYERDPFGNILQKDDLTNGECGLTTYNKYDNYGQCILSLSPTGNPSGTAVGWDNEGYGLWYKIDYSTGTPWIKTWYDSCNREIRKESIDAGNLKIITETSYDLLGKPSTIKVTTGGLKKTNTFKYDNRGRILSENSSSGSRKTYSYGQRSVTIDDNGRTFTKEYDAMGNLKKSIDPVSLVEYKYNSNGKPSSITSGGITTYMEYDEAGNRTLLHDPDAGKNSYLYDAEGKLLKHIDGRGVAKEKSYNRFGQLESETGALETIYYSRDKYGKVTEMKYDGSQINYSYDKFGRIITEMHTAKDGYKMSITRSFDKAGNITSESFSNGLIVNNGLDSYGNCVEKIIGDSTVWKFAKNDGINHTENIFSGKLTLTEHKTEKGVLSSSCLSQNDKNLCETKYVFDPITGNLLSRDFSKNAYEEKFGYDELDRLISYDRSFKLKEYKIADFTEAVLEPNGTGTHISGNLGGFIRPDIQGVPMSFRYKYSKDGNITSATGIGNITYSESHPHAVESVENTDGGISTKTQNIEYNDIGKVDYITEVSKKGIRYELSYNYGPDNQRSFTELWKDGELTRTIHFGPEGEDIDEDGSHREFRYLGNGLLYFCDENGEAKILYMFTDHQGTVLSIHDASGSSVFDASYSPWGEMQIKKDYIGFIRGYTGHEMLKEFSLIDMNGRVYDPKLGRFLSPDPHVQLPDYSQNFNRFSYCLNNPLKYTDASGESILLFNIALSAITGFQAALFKGGNALKGGLIGGISSAITYGIGSIFGKMGSFGHELLRAGAHGLATGTFSSLDGGNFARGFFSGTSASLAGSLAHGMELNKGWTAALSSTIGGLTSLALGDKFFTGAMNGMQIGVLNHLMHGEWGARITHDNRGNMVGELDEVIVWGKAKAGMSIIDIASAICGSQEILSKDVVMGNNGKIYCRQVNQNIFRGNQYVTTRPIKTIPHPKAFGRLLSIASQIPEVRYVGSVYGTSSREYYRAITVACGRILGGEMGASLGGATIGALSATMTGCLTAGLGSGFAYVGGEIIGSIGGGWLGTELGGTIAGYMFDLTY